MAHLFNVKKFPVNGPLKATSSRELQLKLDDIFSAIFFVFSRPFSGDIYSAQAPSMYQPQETLALSFQKSESTLYVSPSGARPVSLQRYGAGVRNAVLSTSPQTDQARGILHDEQVRISWGPAIISKV